MIDELHEICMMALDGISWVTVLDIIGKLSPVYMYSCD